MRLRGKVAIITGAASGMGAATAKLFAREGADVYVADRLVDEGQQVAAEINAEAGRATYVPIDVTDEARWSEMVASVVGTSGQLDILVNNAGVAGSAPSDLFDTAMWHQLMAVNSTGMFFGIKYAAPAMLGGGAITNLSSISGIIGNKGIHPGYNASKGAVRSLTKSAAVLLAEQGIRVNSVHPGVMPPMRGSGAQPNSAFREKILGQVPMGRSGKVDEVAYAVLFLSSDEASYITGAELYVDGGYLAM